MEPMERAALRRKVYLLKSKILLDKRLFEECKRQGLLRPKQISAIKAKYPEHEAYTLLISFLEEQGHVTFDKVCYLLDRMGHTEVTDELQAELQLLKKNVNPVEHQWEESNCSLQKHFDLDDDIYGGKNDVIDLRDPDVKNTVIQLMVNKYMVGKETWVRQYNRKRDQITREKRAIGEGLEDASKEIETFINQKAQLVGIPVEWPERRADTPGTGLHQAAFANLRKKVEVMSAFFDTILKEQEKMVKERLICFRMLGIPDVGTPLNERLENFLSKSYGDLDKAKMALVSTDEAKRHLDSQIYKLQLEMNKKLHIKHLEIETYQKKIFDRDEEMKRLSEEMKSIRHQDDINKAQLSYWKQRCAVLEKTRRLGYTNYPFDYKNGKGKSVEEIKAIALSKFNQEEGQDVGDSLNTTNTSVWDSQATGTPRSNLQSNRGSSIKWNSKNLFLSSHSSTPKSDRSEMKLKLESVTGNSKSIETGSQESKGTRSNKSTPRPNSNFSTKSSENSLPMSSRSSLASKSIGSELNLSFNGNM